MVRIFWKSKITGNTGNGSTYFNESKAKLIVQELNIEHPDLDHWYE